MLKFALKDMWIKRVKVLFVALSIIITAGVALLAFNVATQVKDGIVAGASNFDMILGPAGSSTQLTMNTLFFTDTPLGTIDYSLVRELEQSGRCNHVVPFSMGDSYKSARIIGTTPYFLNGKTLSSGAMFAEDETFTCVLGRNVASNYGLKVGDKLITSHGLGTIGTEHASSPLTVVGILNTTDSAFDNAVFTSYKTVWAVHDHGDHDEHDEHDEHDTHGEADAHDHAEGETHAEGGKICAILVQSKSVNDYTALKSHYGDNAALLVVNPSTVLREVLSNVDISEKIVYALCAVILIMNIFVISVITVMNMYDAREDIALMRLIGISTGRIRLLYLLQNTLTGLVSAVLALGLSRLCLGLVSKITSAMGIVLSIGRVYPAELAIMAGVVVLSVLPTLICTAVMSRKDGIRS